MDQELVVYFPAVLVLGSLVIDRVMIQEANDNPALYFWSLAASSL